MTTLLIVDDEAIIRRGIHFHVNWAENGFEVVAEAVNGEDGLQKAIKYHPDIIITDIRMPVMNGLIMAEKIRELLPSAKIIFISGYDDKEYLLGAIKNGAADFVMKSANSGDILQAALRCRKKIEAESREETPLSPSALMEYCFQSIRLSFMEDIISGKMDRELLLEQAGLLEVTLAGPFYLPFLLHPGPGADIDGMIMSLLFTFNTNGPFLVWKEGTGIIGILNLDSDALPLEAFHPVLDQFNLQSPGAQVLLPKAPGGLEALSYLLTRLLGEKDRLCWYPNQKLIFLKEAPPETVDLNLLLTLEQEILTSFSRKNYMDAYGRLEQFYSFFQQRLVPLNQYQASMERIVIGAFSVSGKYSQALPYLNAIKGQTNADSVFRTMNDMLQEFAPQLPHNSIVKTATEYIEAHYNEQISLNDIARSCCVTPSYLSKIFKNDVKTGIVQYIHNVRIEKARQLLLNTDWKVSEIAAAAGYLDYKRFSSYFLKMTGISPREYRAQGQKEQATRACEKQSKEEQYRTYHRR